MVQDTPLFGAGEAGRTVKYEDTVNGWPNIRSEGSQSLGRMPLADKSRLSFSKRGIGLNGPVNGWNVLGDYERGTLHPIQVHWSNET